MSSEEIDRLKLIELVCEKRLKVSQAAKLMGISPRQLHRLIKRYKEKGPEGLTSKKRGQPSNRAFPEYFRELVLKTVRENYFDFGPTFAAEKLAENHSLFLSKETLRKWMIEEEMWETRKARVKRVYQPRSRRECFGELIQIDGSDHWWFEDRGPRCKLLVYIDDATGILGHMEFAASESTFSYFKATENYFKKHGRPLAFYSDKHSVFRINKKGVVSGNGMTQFGRALHDLQVEIICANTPQAKGRVERANRTLQDRLVKELRLAGINTVQVANDFLEEYINNHNAKFALEPRNSKNLHRSLDDIEDLAEHFCLKEDRTVSKNLTLQYDKVIYLLEPTDYAKGLWKKQVTVYEFPHGGIDIRHEGRPLRFSTFEKVRQVKQAPIVDNKRLGAVLRHIKTEQDKASVKPTTKERIRASRKTLK